ncbi:MAG: ATP cone domain-containing protein [Planctomycetota bacterium]
MSRRAPRIVKSNGEIEGFKESKLRASLRRAGANGAEERQIVAAVRLSLRDGMTTGELYRIAHRMLRRARRPAAARYSLQKALQELGPGGYPFEQFVGELWRAEGWRVRVGARLRGHLVSHEVDVVATRPRGPKRGRELAECKFRNRADGKVDVTVAMYIYGRACDLEQTRESWSSFWLVTNGRFTSDALAYGEGMGLQLLAWDHPAGDSLRERVDRARLHPITALTHLRVRDKRALLNRGIVLCRQLRRRPRLLDELDLPDRRRRQIANEAAALTEE